jgi:uncharacterized SAM-binding protein YcdF (DUF218 family)
MSAVHYSGTMKARSLRRWLGLGLAAAGLIPLLVASLVSILYFTIPERNTNLTHFDTIVVLGAPANPDGSPGPEQRQRVLEGVREYKNQLASHIIMTGGAAHNRFVESEVMAQLAIASGVRPSAISEDTQSRNTIQYAYYAVQIMRVHGWRSAEIVSSASHLPRASLIFSRFPIEWRMHPAPWPTSYSILYPWGVYANEAMYCSRLRLLGFERSIYLPK